ncbi:hypothetical protein AMTRI_Chr07g75580 [Amborella trichopoda]
MRKFVLDYDGKRDEPRRKYLKERQLNKLKEKNNNHNGDGEVSDEEDDEYDLKVDESKSMREDPLSDSDPNEKFYGVISGQALEFKQLNMHSLEAFEKGQDIHMQAAPSQAELLCKEFKIKKEELKSQVKDTIMDKYGNASSQEELPRELLLGQSEREVEYDRAGRIIKGQEKSLPKSKYEEDVYINNHTSVWGSRWKDHQWGYKCCKQTIKNSYCIGLVGIEAAEEPVPAEENNIRIPELDRNNIWTWIRSTGSNSWTHTRTQVTAEDMEAYRMKRLHHDDPMKDFLHLLKAS